MPRTAEHLKPFRFKPGVSGNPEGGAKGPSMKKFARRYLQSLSKNDRIRFLNSIEPDVIWRMAEGNPETNLGGDLKVVINIAKEVADQNDIKPDIGAS